MKNIIPVPLLCAVSVSDKTIQQFTISGLEKLKSLTGLITNRLLGLPNFVDAIPQLGLSVGTSQNLGTNPVLSTTGGCCQAPLVLKVAVDCTSDSVFYKFRVAKVNGVFPHLRVSTTASDFMTTTSLKNLRPNGTEQTISLISALNGSWKPIENSEILGISNGRSYIDFTLKVWVNSSVTNPIGFFKTLVFTINPEINPSGQEDYPFLVSSCCRKAVESDSELKQPEEASNLSLLPNPASQETRIFWTGKEAEFEILDLMGRAVLKKTPLESGIKINTRAFPKGIYQVRVVSLDGISTEKLLID